MKRSPMFKVFILVAVTSIFMVIAGCSDYSKGDKNAFKAVQKHQKEHYPESNKELEIEYPKLKDMGSFINGNNEYGNATWGINGTYTFNHEKVSGMEYLEQLGENHFEAHVVLIDGEYVVTGYTEGLPIRRGIDN